MPDLVVIINSYNRADLLKDALASLARTLWPAINWSLVVFDAGSIDGSRELVEAFSRRHPIATHLLGSAVSDNSFSAGINQAMRFAVETCPGCKFFLLFETDNYLKSANPIRAGMSLLQAQSELGAVGFTVQKHDGSPAGFGCSFPSCFDFVLGPQLAFRLGLDQPRLEWRVIDGIRWAVCDVVYTSPLLVRRDAWEKSGGLDAREFPFSDCDLDWGWRLQKLGWEQAVMQTDGVVHDNLQKLSAWSASRTLHFHRARLSLLRRHRGGGARLIVPLLFARHLIETLFVLGTPFLSAYSKRLKRRWLLLSRCFFSYS